MKSNDIEAILEMIALWKDRIADLVYEKDSDDYRNAGQHLMDISDIENEISRLQECLPPTSNA